MSEESCMTCRFWAPESRRTYVEHLGSSLEGRAWGRCIRNAPRPCNNNVYMACFPETTDDKWCGDYEKGEPFMAWSGA